MSYNTEPERAARRHLVPIIAIAVALAIAALAAFLFLGVEPKDADDVSRIESETPATAEGTETPAPTQPTEAPAAPAQN